MILCCGEALIDMLPRDLPDGTQAYIPYAGGAVFNTAITLGRLGEPVSFLSGISTDMFGDQLAETLNASGVDHRFAIRSARPTTLAFVRLTNGDAQYTFYDENSAGRMITPDQLPDLPTVQAAHFGAISLIGEPCGATYERLANRLSENSVISLDPNIRPGFIHDEEAYRARLDRMMTLSDIVKLSEDDLAWLSGGKPDEGLAAALLGQNAKLVLLTRGARGVTVYSREARFDLAAPAATVADTVGAGDSFNGGLLSGLRRNGLLHRDRLSAMPEGALRNAIDLAMQVAAITVSRAGANPPWACELDLAAQPR